MPTTSLCKPTASTAETDRADIDQPDNEGWTALMIARDKGQDQEKLKEVAVDMFDDDGLAETKGSRGISIQRIFV
jgi:hypothetical protein